MSDDKRYSCKKVPSWYEGIFWDLRKDGSGIRLVLCDSTGHTVSGGNILSITGDGILMRHAGATANSGLVAVNPRNDKIYTYNEWRDDQRAGASAAASSRPQMTERERTMRAFILPSLDSRWVSLDEEIMAQHREEDEND